MEPVIEPGAVRPCAPIDARPRCLLSAYVPSLHAVVFYARRVQERTPDLDALLAGFEQAPAALFVFSGAEHVVLGANRMARSFTGDRPGLVGRPLREVMPELEGQQIFEYLDEVYATGRIVNQPERRVLVDRNGDGSLEEGFFAYTFAPVDLPDGLRGIIVHATETTELLLGRRAAETRAVDSEQRYRQAQDLVLALQEDLLPPGVPVLPAVRLAAR